MNTIKSLIRDIVIVAGLSAVVVFAQSWSGPTATPPDNNTSAPINISSLLQIKTGGLWVGSLGVSGGATINGNVGIGTASPTQKLDVVGYVKGQTGVCIGNDCRTSWPITGTGTITGGGTSGYLTKWSGSNSITNYSGASCPAGQVMSGLNADGTPNCVTQQAAICTWSNKLWSTGARCTGAITSNICATVGVTTYYNRLVHTCQSNGSWSDPSTICSRIASYETCY